MISTFAIECIEGTLKKVQTIVYSTGVTVKRIFEPEAIVPEEVRLMSNPNVQHSDMIEHPEALQYRYHFGVL